MLWLGRLCLVGVGVGVVYRWACPGVEVEGRVCGGICGV